jgi:alpha-N-acetylglucosamine transferase
MDLDCTLEEWRGRMWDYQCTQELEDMEKEDWLSKSREEEERLEFYRSLSPTATC